MNERDTFARDALDGLTSAQRSLPGKYIWDQTGSRIFEAITATAAYYQNDTEFNLMALALPEIASRVGQRGTVVEFGSGASRKIRQVLDALDAPAFYVALDISQEFLEASTADIVADYPHVAVRPIHADYSRPLPPLPINRDYGVLGYLPGTSIGNMVPDDARRLLVQLRRTLAPGLLLIGHDPNRNAALLQAAYEGPLMTALHKNVLVRLEKETGARVNHDAFRHESRTFAKYVEPHLVALVDTRIELNGHVIEMAAGDSIRTDLSWKYTIGEFAELAVSSGWTVDRQWPDAAERFCLNLLRA